MNIDWELLKKQKATLLNVILMEKDGETDKVRDLTGILHLIDQIQDDAVDSGEKTEQEVFG